MASTDKYGHYADGNRPAERARQHGYRYCMISENIVTVYSSAGFTTAELTRQFFQGWKHSPSHRENMLAPNVLKTGVAVAWSEQTGSYYGVQVFGRPQSKMITFEIVNRSTADLHYEIAGRTFPLPPGFSRTHGRCQPVEVATQWPDERERTIVQPQNGNRYTIVEEDSRRLTIVEN